MRDLPFRIAQYECYQYLGGNMSALFLARDVRTERVVVIKLLREEDLGREELRRRFLAEARAACRCSHPNVITTYEADEYLGQPYIAMEYLRGESLRTRLNGGGFASPRELFGIMLQVANALTTAGKLEPLKVETPEAGAAPSEAPSPPPSAPSSRTRPRRSWPTFPGSTPSTASCFSPTATAGWWPPRAPSAATGQGCRPP